MSGHVYPLVLDGTTFPGWIVISNNRRQHVCQEEGIGNDATACIMLPYARNIEFVEDALRSMIEARG